MLMTSSILSTATPVVAAPHAVGADGVPAPFDSYPHSDLLNDIGGPGGAGGPGGSGPGGRRAWQEYGRQNEEKITIPKVFNQFGFK